MSIYIAFEGPIAAGKTTLTQLLAEHINAEVIFEDVDGNEFLADFYEDRARWSLPMQLWFLATRHEQLCAISNLKSPFVVADYSYAKETVFALLLLNDRELRLYHRIAKHVTANVAQPTVIVYLDAVDDVLLQRIKKRGRPYETAIDSDYLDSVREAYEKYFLSTGVSNVLRYDTSLLDLDSEVQLRNLYNSILDAARGSRLCS